MDLPEDTFEVGNADKVLALNSTGTGWTLGPTTGAISGAAAAAAAAAAAPIAARVILTEQMIVVFGVRTCILSSLTSPAAN